MEKKKLFTLRRILVILFLIVFGIIIYINFRGSYLEYKELGENFVHTFLTKQTYQYIVMGVNFVLIYLVMYLTGRKIKKGLKVFFDQEKKQMPKLPNKSIAIVFSLIESFFISKMFTPNIILCISNTSFEQTDPIFKLDISFFMYIEPLLKMILMYFICIFVAVILYTVGYYIIVFNKYFDAIDRDTLKENIAIKTIYRSIRAIALGLALYILVCSMDVVFDNFLTTDNNIKLAGAGFIDSTIKYWGYNILAIILLISIFRAVRSFKKGKQEKILRNLAVVPIYLVILFVVMLGVDLIYVNPNEFDREKTFIEANIAATKRAYGIDYDTQSIDYTGTITVDEAQKNQNVINNTVIIDKQTILDTLIENQSGSGYYTYSTVKLANYKIDGKRQLLYVSPREIISNRRTYNSKTYEYTHGYGLIFTSAVETTDEGEIKYIQNDIQGKDEKIHISTPQIYYGMETNTTVVTGTTNKKEFDYADGTEEYETSYEGDAGLTLNFWDRLILGIKQRDLNLAFSSSVTDDSKVLINRNIIRRAKLALPDVMYDSNPYTVLDENGDIYWVLDAYTVSSAYPYSTYTGIQYDNQRRDINYIRNSIKVIINAYTGEMKYYITDESDPVAMAYRKVYPELFQDLNDKIPNTIQEQFIYPELLFKVQSTMLEEYHNKKADVLYRGDDTWEKISYKNTGNNSKNTTLDPYYTMVKDGDSDTIGLMQVYTQKDKQSIKSYLIGTIKDGKNNLILRSFASDNNIVSPTQLDTEISQDETIQSQIDSLTLTGAKVTKNMIIVPIENTLLYIEPIYQTLVNENNLPVLKKVIVASGNKVAIGDNLQESIQNLISQYATNIEIENTESVTGLIDSIIKANNNLSDSLDSNNWELMGTDLQRLQELINSLEKQIELEEKQNNQSNEKENVDENTTQNLIE